MSGSGVRAIGTEVPTPDTKSQRTCAYAVPPAIEHPTNLPAHATPGGEPATLRELSAPSRFTLLVMMASVSACRGDLLIVAPPGTPLPVPPPFDAGPVPSFDAGPPPVDGSPVFPDTNPTPMPDAGMDATQLPPMTGYGPTSSDLGSGNRFTFNVPSGVLGMNFYHPGSAEFQNDVLTLTDPLGRRFVSNGTPLGFNEVVLFAAVPLSSEAHGMGIMSGMWTLELYGSLHTIAVFQQTPTGAFQGGVLDLNIHLPANLNLGGSVANAANGATHPTLQSYITQIRAMLPRTTGIQLGQVRYFDAPARLSQLSSDSDADGVAYRAATTPYIGMSGVHMVLAQDIPGSTVGFATLSSDPRPGADAVVMEPAGEAAEFASTFVHEFGHYVGLNHTTESDRRTQDEISDTPVCGAGIAEEQCPDANNIMFATYYEGIDYNALVLTPGQRAIFHASPIYQARAAFKSDPERAPRTIVRPAIRRSNQRWVCGHTLRRLASSLAAGLIDAEAPALQALPPADQRRVRLLSQRLE